MQGEHKPVHTAQSIMEILERDVADNKPISPAKWCEAALRVNALAGVVDNQVAHYEAAMNKIEAEYIKTDMPAAKAKVLARSQVEFEEYLKLKATLNRIGEFLSLARKRSQINEF